MFLPENLFYIYLVHVGIWEIVFNLLIVILGNRINLRILVFLEMIVVFVLSYFVSKMIIDITKIIRNR